MYHNKQDSSTGYFLKNNGDTAMHNEHKIGRSDADIPQTPSIRLGGRDWLIPMLSARQNKIIDPLILSLLPLFAEWQTDKASALGQLDQPHYESLQEIALQAIKQASPDITRDTFLELPITLPELVAAFSIIAQQTGIFSRGESGSGEA
jgi:hypothetical protein